MRDINTYSKNYVMEDVYFEKYQVHYRRKKVLEQMSLYKHDTIVEIGCGTEPLFEYFHDYKKMIVIEPSKDFFEIATKKANNDEKILLINSLFEDINLAEENLDFIVLSSLLHEIKDTELFLKKIMNICSKDTVLHINVPNANSFHRILAYESGLIEQPSTFSNMNYQFQINHVFDLKTIEKIVEDIGFEVLEKGSYFIKPFTHGQMKKMMDNNIIDKTILDGLNKMTNYMPDLGSEIFVNVRLKL